MEEVGVSNYPVISVVFKSGIFKENFTHTHTKTLCTSEHMTNAVRQIGIRAKKKCLKYNDRAEYGRHPKYS
jgi:hypothetical protein